MANTLLTPTWILKEAGRSYENSLMFINKVEKKYSDEFTQAGAKVGNTIQYRLPQRWTVSDGQALDVQNILDQTVPISLTNQKHVDMQWSAWQETTEVEEVQSRYTKPAGQSLASVIDGLAFSSVYRDVFNAIGVPGTTPSTTLLYLQAKRKITDFSGPKTRIAVLDPEAAVVIANTTTTLFNSAANYGDNYREGMIGMNQLGIAEWYEDQNRPLFTTGSATGASTPIVSGGSQTGSSLLTTGWSTFSGKKGDIITIAGVYPVNRLSYISTGRLQQFVLTADVTDSGGTATLPISPAIITSGPLQTVNASPAANAVVTYFSMAAGGTQAATASPQGMVFCPEAFAFVTADLAMPAAGAKATRIQSPARGVALRMAETWDPQTDQNITRIDTIVGAATLRPEWAVRVLG